MLLASQIGVGEVEEDGDMTKEEILAMDHDELNIAVAEKIFKAKVIGKENDQNAKLLIGWYGEKAWKPMRGSWTSADWSPSEEIAWLDCPRFSEDMSAAWEVVERFPVVHIEFVEIFEGNKNVSVTIPTDDGNGTITLETRNAPEAICKAALVAVLEATP